MRNIVVGVAGHIDHGKTALVKSLTGISTDRLKEERERRMSIDIGFAYLRLLSGREIDMIDVPGHEKFIKNMVCGASGVDVGILVVAADDGVMPQTREHLDIMRLIGVEKGMIVITKADLADKDTLAIVLEDIEQLTKHTFLSSCPIVNFSVKTAQGKDDILEALDAICESAGTKDVMKDFRMPVDRAFIMPGFGTVVTGTITSGVVKVGDDVTVYPLGLKARVRSLQTHTQAVDECSAGQRVGINLPNIDKNTIERGMIVARPGALDRTHLINVRLDHLASSNRRLYDREKVMLYTGTSEVVARVVLIDKELLEPGETGYAQLRLDESIAPAVFDRFVIRRLSPQITIGGGLVLEVTGKKYRPVNDHTVNHLKLIESGTPEGRVDEFFKRSSFLNPLNRVQIARMASVSRVDANNIIEKTYDTGRLMRLTGGLIHISQYEKLKGIVLERLKEHIEKKPLDTVVPREEIRAMISKRLDNELFKRVLDDLVRDATIILTNTGIRLKSHRASLSKRQFSILEEIMSRSENGDIKPIWHSSVEEIMEKFGRSDVESVIDHMIDEKKLVVLNDGSILTSESYEKGRKTLVSAFSGADGFGLGDFKDALNIGRRAAVCLLEHFDSVGLTSRQGDVRKVVG